MKKHLFCDKKSHNSSYFAQKKYVTILVILTMRCRMFTQLLLAQPWDACHRRDFVISNVTVTVQNISLGKWANRRTGGVGEGRGIYTAEIQGRVCLLNHGRYCTCGTNNGVKLTTWIRYFAIKTIWQTLKFITDKNLFNFKTNQSKLQSSVCNCYWWLHRHPHSISRGLGQWKSVMW